LRVVFVILFFLTLLNSQNINKVSIQLQWLDQFQFAGYYIAKEKGFYTDAGLDVEIKKYSYGVMPIDEVESGRVTFGVGRSSLIIDRSDGKKVVALSSIFQSSPLVLLGLKSSGIKKVSDFKGRNVMSTDDVTSAASFIAMMNSQKIDQKDVNFIPHSFDLRDIITGKTDLMASYISNEPFRLAQKNIDYIIFDPKDYGFDFYSDILFTSEHQIEKHPNIVRKFTEASLKGWEYAFNNIEEAIHIIYDKYNSQNKTIQQLRYEASELKRLAYYKTDMIGDIDKDKIKRILDIYTVLGLIKNKVDIDKFIYVPGNMMLSKSQKEYLDTKRFISVCIDPYWKPFEYIEDGKHKGITSDYMKLFSKIIDKEIKLVPTRSWEESKQYVKQRKCDMLAAASYTKERAEYLDFTTEYLKFPYVIATTSKSSYIFGVDQIKEQKIGMVKGYSFIGVLKQRYPEINIVEFENIDKGLQALSDNEIFAFIDTASTIGYSIRKQNLIDIKISGQLKDIWKLRAATRNDESQLNEIFQYAIDMITPKDHTDILNKWHTIKFDQEVDYRLIWQMIIVVIVLVIIFVYFYQKLKRSKDIAEESLTNIQQIFDTTIEGISVSDENLNIFMVNKAALNIFGYSDGEFESINAINVVAPDSIEKAAQAFSNSSQKEYELNLVKKDGTIFPALAAGKNIVFQGKEARLSTIIDLTQLKEAQNELEKLNNELEHRIEQEVDKNIKKEKLLYQQTRLAQMGEMISMIAHQWRQPLAAISLTIVALKLKMDMNKFDLDSKDGIESFVDHVKVQLNDIEEYINSLSSTVDDFRNFYKPNKQLINIMVVEPVVKSLNIVRVSLEEENILLIEDYSSYFKIDMYDSEMMQVILNIVKNSQDNFKSKNIENKKIWVRTFEDSNSVFIEIEDNGGGIDDDIINNIFDPYFSTKDEKNGTGLGLHMSKIIIEEHHSGKLSVKNTQDGALFTIELKKEN
jgi:PAS domain S-box-containing protein